MLVYLGGLYILEMLTLHPLGQPYWMTWSSHRRWRYAAEEERERDGDKDEYISLIFESRLNIGLFLVDRVKVCDVGNRDRVSQVVSIST